jgi:hypothetical protein
MRLPKKVLVLGASAALVAAPLLASAPASATITPVPFSYAGESWCATFHGNNGCDNVQTPSSLGQPLFNSNFDPAQDTISGKNGYPTMTMVDNGGTISTGAFNGQTQFTVPYGSTITEKLNLPCNSAGTKVAGWPAFWTDGSGSGSNFLPGEIDIAEGLNGSVNYGIHYQNASGQPANLGGTYPGNPLCGVNTFEAIWNSNSGGHVAFYLNGTWINSFDSAQMGVPMFTDAQQVINDYASGSDGGPDVFGSAMQVESYSG